MCLQTLDYLAQGFSNKALCGHLAISDSTLYVWMGMYPEFMDSVHRGKQLGLEKYQKLCMDIADGTTKGSISALKFLLKNIHGWREEPKEKEQERGSLSFSIQLATPDDAEDEEDIEDA